MLTNHEARAFYTEFLDKLRRLDAEALARDIEKTVLRGALRSEAGSSAKAQTFQTPLSPREALAVALRMFLAALDPALQIPHVREVLGAGSGGEDDTAPELVWAFDRLEPGEEPDHEMLPQADPRTLGELEALPEIEPESLTALREMARQLASLVAELETEGE